MVAYYNEFDPKAAAWLRQLIAAGHIAPGVVDERSIADVTPNDLSGYTQCHFFAGIGVWSYALRRAGWSDSRPVWTGSCPCQPFSAAGKGSGFDDERHLWPHFHWLIDQCRPERVFGEQVASKDGLGWLDLVQADLEGSSYASGAIDTCSAGFGAPHIRQRLWWVAERMGDTDSARLSQQQRVGRSSCEAGGTSSRGGFERPGSSTGWLDHSVSDGRRQRWDGHRGDDRFVTDPNRRSGGLVDANGGNTGTEWQQRGGKQRQQQGDGSAAVGAADDARLGRGEPGPELRRGGERGHQEELEQRFGRGSILDDRRTAGPVNGIWRDADWLFCRDGKWRPVEPGTFPLAHGAAVRVGRLRGYGNAINAEAATGFIQAYLETEAERFRLTDVYEMTTNVGAFA